MVDGTDKGEGRGPQRGIAQAAARAEDVDWPALLRTLWRRRWLVLGAVVLCVGGAAAYLHRAVPVFEAESLVMIKEREARVAPIEEVMPGLRASQESLAGQMLLIRSRSMLDKLVARIDLGELPELNPSLRPPGLVASLGIGLARWLPADWAPIAAAAAGNRLLLEAGTRRVSELDLAAYLREAIVDEVQSRLTVQPASTTNVIAIRFASADPALAARVANELAALYIDDTLEEKRAAAGRVRGFLEAEITRLRNALLTAEGAVQEYRREAGLVSTATGPVDAQQLAQLSTELVLVRSERAAAEARAAALRRLIAGGQNAEAAAQFMQSATLLDLQARELDVKRRLAEASIQYGARHPTMVALNAEIEELQSRKVQEAQNLLQGLINEAQAIRSREAAIEASLEQSKGQVARVDDAGVRHRALEREAEATRHLLETYLARQSEISSQEKAQEPDARVISPAVPPEAPVSPRRMTILMLSLLGGLFVGSVGAVSLEQLDRTVHSGDQLESLFGVRPIGLVPRLDERRLSDQRVAAYVLDRPRSRFGEAIRALRAAIVTAVSDTGPVVLLVTSALPGEGKSTVAVALARLHAQSGARTLLIDADLRRPRLDVLLDAGERPGLGDILGGREVQAASVIHKDPQSGLEFLSAGHDGGDPTLLLGATALRRLVAGLRLRYELIVIDSPPLIGITDARLLLPLADATLFLVRWGATRQQDVAAALRTLREGRGPLVGAALTMVDVRRHAAYGYSDSGHYYYDRYSKYYEA